MTIVLSATLWSWILLIGVVLSLALYRLMITRGDYTILHVRRSELSLIPEQIMHNSRLERVDLWGQTLTVLAVIIGIALAVMYLYTAIA
jgi:hypothetical protein